MPNVFTNGCFDLFHPGHYQLLTYCRYLAEGGDVIVALDTDAKVARDKGRHRPYYTEKERRDILMVLTQDGRLSNHGYGKYLVTWIESFNTDDELYRLVQKHKPDYIVKGADWKGKHVVGSDLATVHFTPSYFKDMFSTTAIEQRILSHHKRSQV
jgi:D-beta-D-heptose 7-phosphate kinase/D-beta-D-heptose 1-phosphate adenosyltransferase